MGVYCSLQRFTDLTLKITDSDVVYVISLACYHIVGEIFFSEINFSYFRYCVCVVHIYTS